MNKKDFIIGNLKKIKDILESDNQYTDDEIACFLYIENKINEKYTKEYKLPKELKNFLTFKDYSLLDNLFGSIYIPFNLTSFKDEFCLILNGFQSKNSELMPIILTEVAEKKILDGTEDWENEESSYIQAIVKNSYQFMPLYNGGGGSFIFFDLASAQLICAGGLEWNVLAPSFCDHIDDLVQGIDNDYYAWNIDLEEIEFPYSWYLRKLTKEGKYFLY